MSAQDDHYGHADCSEVLTRIFEYLDGELTARDVDRVREHLAACEPCLAQHEFDRAMKALVRRSCAMEQAPASLRLSIVQRITTVRVERPES